VMNVRDRMVRVVRDRGLRDGNGRCNQDVTSAPRSCSPHLTGSMRVLVVDDHVELANIVATGLRREGLAVDVAFSGEEALRHAAIYGYDVIVLDRDLPDLHGDRVCETLVQRGGRARVLMLTASGEIEDRVAGLSIGADDYLAKPFAFAELVARVRALARRAQPAVPPVLRHADLTLDPGQRVAHRSGRRLDLSAKELAVLELLLAAQGNVLSPEELLERAWDEVADPFSNVVKVTISRLRRKLGDPPIIETVPGAGYRV
jgi:DNA-binding response OmpR family regulator